VELVCERGHRQPPHAVLLHDTFVIGGARCLLTDRKSRLLAGAVGVGWESRPRSDAGRRSSLGLRGRRPAAWRRGGVSAPSAAAAIHRGLMTIQPPRALATGRPK